MEKDKNIKTVLIALIAIVVIGASMGFGYFIAKHPSDKPAQGQSETSYDNESEYTEATSQISPTSEKATEETEKSDAVGDSAALLLGAWTDNANFSGYEFFENGTIQVTYFNMEAINLDEVINGKYKGTYTVDKDKLSISYTIYSKAITKNYTFSVDENTLTLKGDGEEAIYVRKGAQAVMDNVDKQLLGKWKSNLSGFEFKDTGVVAITFIDLSSMGINIPINGTVDGIYTVSADEVTVKYSIYTGVIEKTYKYSVKNDVLTLTEKGSHETGTYIREK